MYYISKEFQFEASHKLLNYIGKCHRNHGHNYKIIVTLARKNLNKRGMGMDFGQLKEIVNKEIIDVYDHRNLNKCHPFNIVQKIESKENSDKLDVLYNELKNKYDDDVLEHNRRPQLGDVDEEIIREFNTTAENMARIFYVILKKKIDCLESITIYETDSSSVIYRDEGENNFQKHVEK